jgi:hypothetical protein
LREAAEAIQRRIAGLFEGGYNADSLERS